MSRVLVLLIKIANQLLWSAFYFVLSPNEADADELRLYNQRIKW